MSTKLGFIGAGNMNGAIIRGVVAAGYPIADIKVSNRSAPALEQFSRDLGLATTTNNHELAEWAEVIVLGVKPYQVVELGQQLTAEHGLHDRLLISVAAGLDIQTISTGFAGHPRIIRAMPNTPSAVGFGMSGLFASSGCSEDDKGLAEYVLNQVGRTVWVSNEADIDTVIAAAGSSPAYFYLIAEAMIEQAERMGLAPRTARELVQQAMAGSAQMLIQHPDTSASALRQAVTSKGGTTAAAIESLQRDQISSIMHRAMTAAVERSKVMTKDNAITTTSSDTRS